MGKIRAPAPVPAPGKTWLLSAPAPGPCFFLLLTLAKVIYNLVSFFPLLEMC